MKTIEEVLNKLTAKFAYTKANGELRFAEGTRNLSLIEKEHHPTGNSNSNDEYIRYFDFEANGWRMFKEESVVFYISPIMSPTHNLENLLDFETRDMCYKDAYAYKAGYYYSMLKTMCDFDHFASDYVNNSVSSLYNKIVKENKVEKAA